MPKDKAEFVDFKTVKQSVTMLQVLDHYGITASLKRSGDSLNGPCPLHGGENPTAFRVSVSKNCYNCFGECKSGGNVLDFTAKKENVSIRQAALLLQQWFAIGSKPKESATPANGRKADQPEQKESADPKQEEQKPASKEPEKEEPPAEPKTKNEPLGFALKNIDANHAYLQERGLTAETIEAFGLGYCAKGSMAGRIVIPIHNVEGNLVAYAGRWPGNPTGEVPKYKLPNGFLKNLEVYNLQNAMKENPSEPLVLVEGFFGCMKFWQAGVRRTVSLMGWSISDFQAALIIEAAKPQGHVIVVFDEDEAGREAREKAVSRLATDLFVKTLKLGKPGLQPDMLSAQEINDLLAPHLGHS